MFSRNRSNLLASAFSPLFGFRFGIHFNTPDNDSGGTGGGTATAEQEPIEQEPEEPNNHGGAGGTNGDREQLKRAIRDRKKARQAFNAVLRGIGIDPSIVKTVATNDPLNPVRIESVHGGDITNVLQAARAGIAATSGGTRQPKGGTVAAVEVETLRGERQNLLQQNKALTAYIRRMAVIIPIRSACVKHGAIDDDGGNFSDIVRELEGLFQVDIDIDSDNPTAEPDVTVTPMSGGKPMMNAQTNSVHTPETLVIDLLTRKPKHRAAGFRPGPGAGGQRVGGNVTGNRQFTHTVTPAAAEPQNEVDKTANAVAQFFGLNPNEVKTRMQ